LHLSAELPPKVLKAHRTRRRRIRSYVGSVDNLATVAWTIGAGGIKTICSVGMP